MLRRLLKISSVATRPKKFDYRIINYWPLYKKSCNCMDVTQRCVTFVARLLPGPVRRYPEPDDPADGEYSYWALGRTGKPPTADAPRGLDLVLRCPPSADRKYHSHIHVASSTPRRPQARLRMAGNRHNTDKRGHTRNSAGVVAQTPPTRHPTLAETCDACEGSRVRKPQQT